MASSYIYSDFHVHGNLFEISVDVGIKVYSHFHNKCKYPYKMLLKYNRQTWAMYS